MMILFDIFMLHFVTRASSAVFHYYILFVLLVGLYALIFLLPNPNRIRKIEIVLNLNELTSKGIHLSFSILALVSIRRRQVVRLFRGVIEEIR